MRTALPAAPQRGDGRADFSDDADAFAEAMVLDAAQANTQITEANALALRAEAAAASAVLAPGTNATSSTSLTVGTGSRTLGIQTGKGFVKGLPVAIVRTSAPTTWMAGAVDTHDAGAGALTVIVAETSGAGTFTDWTVVPTVPRISRPAATKEQVWAATTEDAVVTPKSLAEAAKPVAKAFAATLTLDGDTFLNADIGTVTSNFSLAAPQNMKAGTSGRIRFTIGGSGGYTWSVALAWNFEGGTTPPLPTAVGKRADLWYFVDLDGKLSSSLRRDV